MERQLGLGFFVLSDLHTDYSENMAWVKCLSAVRYKKDILLVAGDVAEMYKTFVLTMSLLKERFMYVFYVPGNHGLWCRGEDYVDSIEKLNTLLDACRRIGVETGPKIVDGLGFIPMFSWYHESSDREKDIQGIYIPSLEMNLK
ncbi:acyl-carrier-protein phosphodiesterase PptH-like [Telopea speciosissima]|uniref:acyl-carrier-protein phosphodiesterase PptH-like n=1 Tax=Telopea speciosissima TaxID=54955 RepID=UPI001CC54B86|nr:acyl-carrier-protein phosphodiesterase PptH-like [Telopea speciosissima]